MRYGSRTVRLDDRYAATSGRVLLSGIEALVRVVLDQRRLDESRSLDTAAYVSGYEGSPLAGLDIELRRAQRFLDEAGVVFAPAVNEELAATAAAGTQLLGGLPGRRHDGVTAYWFGKNPGLDRAGDAIRHGNHAGTAPLGGVVAFVGDDPGAKSSTVPSSCEWTARSLGMPLLEPGSVDEVLRLGLHAGALSRHAGTWVAVQIVADVADSAATVEIGDPAEWIPKPDPDRPFRPPVLLGPQATEAERDLVAVRLPRAAEYIVENGLNTIHYEPPRPSIGVVAPGSMFGTVLRALSDLGIDEPERRALGLRLVRLGAPWPMAPQELRRLLTGLSLVFVVEAKGGFVESQVKDALYGVPDRPVVVGKLDAQDRPLLPNYGGLDADTLYEAFGRVFGDALPERARVRLDHLVAPLDPARGHHGRRLVISSAPDDGVPLRTPYFCSGCPHNRSTRAADGVLVGMGIGCHTMVALDDEGRGHHVGLTQMGGEGAQWNGLSPFTDDPHFVQNLGDGTFFHSGSLAIRSAVAAGTSITYKLLYNDAVAMTGGQSPVGRMDVPHVVRWLAVEGVRRVVVTTPEPALYRRVHLDPIAEVRPRTELAAVEAELATVPGVTVLLYDDRCAAQERRLRERGELPDDAPRAWVNQRVCEGCGDCGRVSSCLSVIPVETELGHKTAIHQGSCNHDLSCLEGDCPAFVRVTTATSRDRDRAGRGHRRARRAGRRSATPPATGAFEVGARDGPVAPADLPDPVRRVGTEVAVRMPGIGGTGVVTVSRVLQMAALLSGGWAAGLEQTGLAQKGGPVVSDVRLSERPVEGAVRLGRGDADVLLGFDVLGAAGESGLSVADPDRTIAVVSSSVVPTAAMVRHPDRPFPAVVVFRGRIDRATRAADNVYIDAEWIAEKACGDYLVANVVLLGAAFQHGCLPVEADALEEAIRLNGVAVERNLAAFRWGRAAIAAPEAVTRSLGDASGASGGLDPGAPARATAQELVERAGLPRAVAPLAVRRAADLVDYQHAPTAERYVGLVANVAAVESARAPDDRHPVTLAYAKGLHKLMAYKDEYEVARLHLLAGERARLTEELGPHVRARVLLHPPLLRAIGLRHKISLGPLQLPAFRVLRAMRRLRSTPFDPFGRTAMRRTERQLPLEYDGYVARALQRLDPDTVEAVVAVAELPELVRGYESIKAAGIDHFRSEATARLAALEGAVEGPIEQDGQVLRTVSVRSGRSASGVAERLR